MTTVSISRGAPHFVAECETCGIRWDAVGTSAADNARAAAKRHVEQTAHRVYAERMLPT